MSLTALGSPLLTEWWPLFGEHAGGDAPAPTQIITRPTAVSNSGAGAIWQDTAELAAGTGPAFVELTSIADSSRVLVMEDFVDEDDAAPEVPDGSYITGIELAVTVERDTLITLSNARLSYVDLVFPDASTVRLTETVNIPNTGESTVFEWGGTSDRYGFTSAQLAAWIGQIAVHLVAESGFENEIVLVDSAVMTYHLSETNPDRATGGGAARCRSRSRARASAVEE